MYANTILLHDVREGTALTILEAGSECIAVVDSEEEVLYANKAFLAFAGHPDPLPAGARLIPLLPPVGVFRDLFSWRVREVARTGRRIESDDACENGGRRCIYRTLFFPIACAGAGDAIGISLRDVTEERAREESHRRSEEAMRALIEGLPQMICRYGADGVITCANRAFRAAFSGGRDPARGTRVHELVAGISFDKLSPAPAAAREPAEAEISEELYAGDPGAPRVHRWTHTPLFDAEGRFVEFQSVGVDQTEEMRARAELHRSRNYAMIGHAASVLAHELKSPLTSIAMNVGLMRTDPAVTAAASRSLLILDKETQRMQHLVHDLLDFVRPAGTRIGSFHLADLMEELPLLAAERLHSGRIALQIRVEDRLLRGDHVKIRAAFFNLLINAIEACGSEGSIRISTHPAGGGEPFRISIRDSGCGVASPERIFEPFFTTKSSGTGLGLPIAKRIFDEHGWDLALTETTGQGTLFTVRIPQPATA